MRPLAAILWLGAVTTLSAADSGGDSPASVFETQAQEILGPGASQSDIQSVSRELSSSGNGQGSSTATAAPATGLSGSVSGEPTSGQVSVPVPSDMKSVNPFADMEVNESVMVDGQKVQKSDDNGVVTANFVAETLKPRLLRLGLVLALVNLLCGGSEAVSRNSRMHLITTFLTSALLVCMPSFILTMWIYFST